MTGPHPDPLHGLSVRALVRLARRAQRTARLGGAALEDLAVRTGVPPVRLRMLAEAWNEGGRSGIVALGPAPPYPAADELCRATAVLEGWRRERQSLDPVRWDVWRNRVTLWRAGDAVVHLRLTAGGRWHLYRKAAHGDWWPVAVNGRRRPQSIEDCLDALPLTAPRRGDGQHETQEPGATG